MVDPTSQVRLRAGSEWQQRSLRTVQRDRDSIAYRRFADIEMHLNDSRQRPIEGLGCTTDGLRHLIQDDDALHANITGDFAWLIQEVEHLNEENGRLHETNLRLNGRLQSRFGSGTMTVSVPARVALRTGWHLFWTSLSALRRNSAVDFSVGGNVKDSDSSASV